MENVMNYGSAGGNLAATGTMGSAVIGGYYVSGLGLAVTVAVAAIVVGAMMYRVARRKGKRVSV